MPNHNAVTAGRDCPTTFEEALATTDRDALYHYASGSRRVLVSILESKLDLLLQARRRATSTGENAQEVVAEVIRAAGTPLTAQLVLDHATTGTYLRALLHDDVREPQRLSTLRDCGHTDPYGWRLDDSRVASSVYRVVDGRIDWDSEIDLSKPDGIDTAGAESQEIDRGDGLRGLVVVAHLPIDDCPLAVLPDTERGLTAARQLADAALRCPVQSLLPDNIRIVGSAVLSAGVYRCCGSHGDRVELVTAPEFRPYAWVRHDLVDSDGSLPSGLEPFRKIG